MPTRNYLRVRGEYLLVGDVIGEGKELPPRARRIHSSLILSTTLSGTTSACAENTPTARPPQTHHRNYLRVRGEYCWIVSRSCPPSELPPRARRIRRNITNEKPIKGTTSACAENTDATPNPALSNSELPPRARRILPRIHAGHRGPGTTSACAENTSAARRLVGFGRNYLRVRGEYI